MEGLLNLIRYILHLPPFRWYRIRKYQQRFIAAKGWQGLHFGIYDTFEQARNAIPAEVAGWLPDNNG